jgi:hypothetical protein
MTFTRDNFERYAARCPAAWRPAALAVATLTAETVEIPDAEAERLRRELINARLPSRPGLGDAVAAIATPIARALGLSCIDPATQQLRPESPCAQRKAALNRVKFPGD